MIVWEISEVECGVGSKEGLENLKGVIFPDCLSHPSRNNRMGGWGWEGQEAGISGWK